MLAVRSYPEVSFEPTARAADARHSDAMTSDQPPPHRSATTLRRAQQEGFAARSSGTGRAANPHVHTETLPHIDVAKTETRKAAAEAWWRGWDQADGELAQPRETS
jgi:hypothetical protein